MNSKIKVGKGKMDGSIWSSSSKMKEICKCCRKDLGLFSGNIALFRGKCFSCRQKICNDCVAGNLCHKCRVKRNITLNPKELIELPSKRLVEISSTLHVHNPQGYEKSELVQLILAIYGCKWKRPIPQQPDYICGVQGDGKCVLCESEPLYKNLVFCQKCTSMLNQPEFLMNLPARQLQCIVKLLSIPENEMKALEKGELVTIILQRIGTDNCWKPPLPPEPSTSNPKHNSSSETKDEKSSSGALANDDCEILSENQQLSAEIASDDDDDVVIVTGNTEFSGNSEQHFAHIENLNDITDVSVIEQLKNNQLKQILRNLGEDTDGIFEREHLVNKVAELWTNSRFENGATEPDEETRPAVSTETVNGGEGEEEKHIQRSRVAVASEVPDLKSFTTEEEIKALSVRQLKMLLQKHSVNYAVCRERSELADKVLTLWKNAMKLSSKYRLV